MYPTFANNLPPNNLPLEQSSYDPARSSVESDSTHSSRLSVTSGSSIAADEATLVSSPNTVHLAAVSLPRSFCESPDHTRRLGTGVSGVTSNIASPTATPRSYSPRPSFEVPEASVQPVASSLPATACMGVVPISEESPILQARQDGERIGMHSVGVVTVTPTSESAGSERLDSPAKDEAPATKPPWPATPSAAVKEESIDLDDIDAIVRDWAPPLDLASVVKTRRRKQHTSILRPAMSSHRMPSHFKKRAQEAPRKTSSSQTPSKTPSPAPPPALYYPRSPSPFIPLPPPLPAAAPSSALVPQQSLRTLQTKPRVAKPAQPRKPRVTKPAAVVSRASPAHHPATGRPSKACVFCRRRKIGCTQSDSSKESCQYVFFASPFFSRHHFFFCLSALSLLSTNGKLY